ncbi:MAG: bifunctional chorismate mutase/prephenate dehydrogenase [Gammaproteobacteria bacterium]|nr:MAG: bifunctional chorismate mutase/prephenate dehydrogenase [Gammaproteobacteria bacterium]
MSSDSILSVAELLELRRRLDAIDTGIIDLIAERQAVVTTIAEHKLKTGLPLRHYEREREVIDRGVARAESRGLPGSVARDILETLIHHSLSNQETHKLVQSDHGQGRRALVIGGLGRMGVWMSRYLDMVGYNVDVTDLAGGDTPFTRVDDWQSVVHDYDLIVVAVPLRPSNDILLQLAEIRPQCLVFDIGSLKSPMREGLDAMRRNGCRVCSVHPMFGPDEIGLSGRHILFVDVGDPRAVTEARELFSHTAADCVELSLEEHDEVMAWVLGLSHLVNIAFAGALAESGEAVPLLKQISSSTFRAQLNVATQVVNENPHLYYEIQQGNENTAEVSRQFRKVLDELMCSVVANDEAVFTRYMAAAKQRLAVEKSGKSIGQT